MSRPIVTELTSETIEGFKTVDGTVFVGYISPGDDVARESFALAAEQYHAEFTFGLVSDDELINAQNLEPPTVVCHVVEDGETRTRTLNPVSELEDLQGFILEASRPVIGDLLPYDHLRQRLHDVSCVPKT